MIDPKVSIIISIHNGEQTLDRCFESIQNQTFQDFEVICVNDASDDKSAEKISAWKDKLGKDKFILLANEENLGLTKSLNLALAQARGKYMARIDVDDFWKKEKLEKQLNFMEKNPEYGIIGCNYINIFEDNRPAKEVKKDETDEELKRKIFRQNPFAHSCILAKKDILEKVGNYKESIIYGQDYNLWLRCLPLTKFYNLQEFLCERSVAPGGISIQKQNAQMMQCVRTRMKYIREYRYPWTNYFYILEPLLVALSPDFIKNLKRRIM